MEFLTETQKETKKLGYLLAKKNLRKKRKNEALVIGLEGDLGGGKTTFLQGFARGLGIKEKILSPTFIIFRRFKVQSSKFKVFYHVDCYRIQKSKEILDLGFEKIISDQKNIVAVEWVDKIKKIMPQNTTWISFYFANKNKRKIVIK